MVQSPAANLAAVETKEANESACTYVGVELPDEGGEVAVLEVLGQEVPGELGRVPDDEGVAAGAPGDDVVGGRVVDHVVGLDEERRRPCPAVGRRRRGHSALHLPSPRARSLTVRVGLGGGWDRRRLEGVEEWVGPRLGSEVWSGIAGGSGELVVEARYNQAASGAARALNS
jgi:hypothetical protein